MSNGPAKAAERAANEESSATARVRRRGKPAKRSGDDARRLRLAELLLEVTRFILFGAAILSIVGPLAMPAASRHLPRARVRSGEIASSRFSRAAMAPPTMPMTVDIRTLMSHR